MTTTEIYTVLKTWINTILNTSGASIGNCIFTNGSKEITGTNFITNGIVRNNGMVKRTSDNIDFYSKVQSFTETKITLFNNYLGTTGSNVAGEYKASFIPITRGEQNAPQPKEDGFIVIHQPMSVREYATGNYSKGRKVVTGTAPNQVVHGYVDFTNHYQATITIEEVGFVNINGDKLRTLLDSLKLQNIKSYFKTSKVSILRSEGINPVPQISENIWTLRSTLDLIILFPNEGTYEPGIIETVEFEGVYE